MSWINKFRKKNPLLFTIVVVLLIVFSLIFVFIGGFLIVIVVFVLLRKKKSYFTLPPFFSADVNKFIQDGTTPEKYFKIFVKYKFTVSNDDLTDAIIPSDNVKKLLLTENKIYKNFINYFYGYILDNQLKLIAKDTIIDDTLIIQCYMLQSYRYMIYKNYEIKDELDKAIFDIIDKNYNIVFKYLPVYHLSTLRELPGKFDDTRKKIQNVNMLRQLWSNKTSNIQIWKLHYGDEKMFKKSKEKMSEDDPFESEVEDIPIGGKKE